MVQVAKRTQVKVRKLARKIGHEQTPAYYDPIIGDLYLAPKGAIQEGKVSTPDERCAESSAGS